jgi:hypothetical protein
MTMRSLVHPLFDGPIDLIGDVHGHLEALCNLLSKLGYHKDGSHPKKRRLVFLGDLTDRGPDSIGVLKLVKRFIDNGRAQCVLGNHDFNLLRKDANAENGWFIRKASAPGKGLQMAVGRKTENMILKFLGSLPLALENQHLRVVHACWRDGTIDVCREATSVLALYHEYDQKIKKTLKGKVVDKIQGRLERQNRNPVKLLTSGPEKRTKYPFWAGGKKRWEKRVSWWEDYDAKRCVFGHYSTPLCKPHRWRKAICIDYGVGWRGSEQCPDDQLKLAAVQFPEKNLVFDDGKRRKSSKCQRYWPR